ncbi:hypothetical protein GF391_04020 [Candidatus Uhrbacteria bacterium]|nr:hypothetical protein [Candidatus Uhrbacteria bacterium]
MHTSSIIDGEKKRIVLFPQGNLATEQDRDKAAQMLLFCGADPMRFIDHAYPNLPEEEALKRYIRYVSRLEQATLERAIVLLIKTESVPYGILKPRQELCEQVPPLKKALWCVYIDAQRDPFVFHNLVTVGKIYGAQNHEQVFVDYRNNNYLLLRNDCASLDVLRDNAQQIRRNTGSFVDREMPTSPRVPDSEPPLSRDDFLGRNPRPTPARSYRAPKPDRPRPVKPVTEDTRYTHSWFPKKRNA